MNKKIKTNNEVCVVCKAKRYSNAFLLLILFYILLIPVNAFIPDGRYRQAMVESKIKAIATITKVETTSIDRNHIIKKATFKLEYEFIENRSKLISKIYSIFRKLLGNETPQTFTGICQTVYTREENKNIMTCGGGFSRPQEEVGARVVVTVSEDGGSITSLIPMKPELEKAIRETPEKLEFSWDGVYIKKTDHKY